MLVRRLAWELKRRFGLAGAPLKPEHLHMTVEFFGAFPELTDGIVETAKWLGAGVVAAPFDVTLKEAISFRNDARRPLVLQGRHGGFDVLQRAIWRVLGPDFRGRKATPHMTLLYDDQMVKRTGLAEPISFAARELVLVHSIYGESRHEHLAKWPLRG